MVGTGLPTAGAWPVICNGGLPSVRARCAAQAMSTSAVAELRLGDGGRRSGVPCVDGAAARTARGGVDGAAALAAVD